MISPLLRGLARALEQNAIPYCHWKGNYRLASDTASEGDFDILIDRAYWSSAISLLTELGFKLALPRWSSNTAAMLHYFGFDSAQENLVHVHLHGAIFSGENFIDSHYYPFTQLLLRHTETCNGFRVPGRGAELLVYVLKVYIRFGSFPDLLMQWCKPKGGRCELQWLQEGNAEADAINLLNEYFPAVEEKLFRQCLQLLNENSDSLAGKIRLALRVRKRLRICSRFSAGSRLQAYVQVVSTRVVRVFNATSGSKILASGGAVITLDGPSVNTTVLLANCADWLSGKLIVRRVDIAKPPSTWLTLPVNTLLPVLRILMPGVRVRCLASQLPDASGTVQANTLAALLYALRRLCFASDKLWLLQTLRRAAANGWIVLCDHYPVQANGAIDGPRLRPAAASSGLVPRLYEWLRHCELSLYQHKPRPDIAIHLRGPLDAGEQNTTARSTASNSVVGSQRQKNEWLGAADACVVKYKSTVAAEELLLRVKNTIWQAL